MGKNLQKVQDMLDGKGSGKLVVGNHSIKSTETHKVGDKWTDSEGYTWEQKDGFQVKSGGSMPARGMFNHQCKDCGKNCSPKMAKGWDRDTWKADGRCYHCQMNFEIDLQIESKLKWFAYRRLKDLQNILSNLTILIPDNHNSKSFFEDKVKNKLTERLAVL